jgi:hypothetical protein
MADNNPDEKIDAFLNSLDRLREKTEDHLLAQEGYERRTDGSLKGISLPEAEVGTSDRVEEIFKFFINRDGGYLASRTLH